jgi:hypothetical protein
LINQSSCLSLGRSNEKTLQLILETDAASIIKNGKLVVADKIHQFDWFAHLLIWYVLSIRDERLVCPAYPREIEPSNREWKDAVVLEHASHNF